MAAIVKNVAASESQLASSRLMGGDLLGGVKGGAAPPTSALAKAVQAAGDLASEHMQGQVTMDTKAHLFNAR